MNVLNVNKTIYIYMEWKQTYIFTFNVNKHMFTSNVNKHICLHQL